MPNPAEVDLWISVGRVSSRQRKQLQTKETTLPFSNHYFQFFPKGGEKGLLKKQTKPVFYRIHLLYQEEPSYSIIKGAEV